MTQEGTTPSWGASLSWQSLNVLLQVLLQLVYIRVLAGMLTQEDFGIMAIALIVVGVVEIFAQVGIGPSIVQFQDLSPEHVASAWWFSALLGLGCFGLMFLAAPHIAAHYDLAILAPVLRWISLSFVISGFSVVSRSLLVRQMNFKGLTGCALLGMLLGNLCVGLGLAYSGAGVWAYVSALLVQNLILSMGYLYLANIPWSLGFSVGKWRELLGYGLRSTAFNMLTYAAAKMDVWLVGERLSTASTGIYDRAVNLMGQPITVLGKLGDSVLFSGMSSIQDQTEAMRGVTLRGMHLISLLTLPLTVALVLQAQGVTWLFLGDRFADAAPVVHILFAAVAFRALTKLGDANLRAMDGLRAGIFIKLIFLGSVTGGVYWALLHGHGTRGVAWAIVAASVLQWLLTTLWVMATLSLGTLDVLKTQLAGIVLALTVALPMWTMDTMWGLETLVGGSLGLALLLWFPGLSLPAWADSDGALRKQLGQKMPRGPWKKRWSH